MDIFEVPGCHLVQQISSKRGSQKLFQGFSSHKFIAYLSISNLFWLSELWSYYQKDVNQITLNYATFQSLAFQIFEAKKFFQKFCWLLMFPWINLSWQFCSMWDKPWWLNYFWQFLREASSSFNLKGFYYSYAWSCRLCERKAFFCLGLISRKLHRFLCFQLLYLTHCLTSFLLYWSPSSSLCMAFYSISSNIDEFLLISLSANVFVFGDFHVYHKDWLTYCGGTDKPGELCYNLKRSYSDG